MPQAIKRPASAWAKVKKSQSKATKGRPRVDQSTPSSTQLLLQRLATRPPPLKREEIQPLPQLQPQPSVWRSTPWLWTREQWHPYLGYHLPARYKLFYALRQTPRFLLIIVILSLRYPIKRRLNSSPTSERQTPERSIFARADYNSLTAQGNITMCKAINAVIKPWGKIGMVQGPSMFPTFSGDEIIYSSFKRLFGQGLQVGEIVIFVHPSCEDAYMLKRVRALEGEAFYQQSQVERRGEFLVEVPPGHCYVLGDNSKNSNDSRSLGAIPLNSIASIVIWKWGVDGFKWVKHGRRSSLESQPLNLISKSTRKREVLDNAPPPRRLSPKATIVIPKRLPENPVMKD